MLRLLFDLNVILDVLLAREPHLSASREAWMAVERGRAEGLISAHGVTTLHYLAGRVRGSEFADRCVGDILSVFGVAAVNEVVVRRAVLLGWSDFEDAVTVCAAVQAECSAVVTRNAKDFERSPLPILPPSGVVGAVRSLEPER